MTIIKSNRGQHNCRDQKKKKLRGKKEIKAKKINKRKEKRKERIKVVSAFSCGQWSCMP